MENIHAIVAFLEGKKALILSIAGLIISFLVTDGVLRASLGTLLQSILSLLGTGAVAVGSTQGYQAFRTNQVGE